MRAEVTEFRTRKGNRVYKRSRVVNSEVVFAKAYTMRVKQNGKPFYFDLGVSKRDAGMLADEIDGFLAVDGNTVQEALVRYSGKHKDRALREAKAVPTAPVKVLTVGAMIESYGAVTAHLSPYTLRNNTQALRHIAAGILELPKLGRDQTKAQFTEWREKVHAFPLSGFTAPAIEAFRQRELAEYAGDFKKLGSVATTLNTYLRNAKGIFAKKLLPQYAGLILPDPLPFRGIYPLPEPSHRYQSKIDVGELIETAKKGLYPTEKDAWIAFLLSFAVGLRRQEIDKLMWDQVNFDDRRISIHTTEFFRPKAKNSDNYVDISEAVADFLLEYKKANPERRFVLPGKEVSRKIRCAKVFEVLLKWLRQNGVNERTPVHTLRKEAGSIVFEKSGSIDKVANFLRNDARVARAHYVARKSRLELELPGL